MPSAVTPRTGGRNRAAGDEARRIRQGGAMLGAHLGRPAQQLMGVPELPPCVRIGEGVVPRTRLRPLALLMGVPETPPPP